jgi:hypothetical protein
MTLVLPPSYAICISLYCSGVACHVTQTGGARLTQRYKQDLLMSLASPYKYA